ncbi:MAG: hypothetical protein COS14_04785 [Bacteroidetes bacterium CG02_land_8_20_14_3_00_31_25]|nr:hypothetical protein [Bacteroidota bacterium]PIV60562.1 MAG: hypothetical protein COS14_04785 [Bacteroidetes bacterium CG02_land_8_20_14_3_00_31_25]PIX34594.1 MAG: hypothetical protein COZ59_07605 [Bacteroidetes bacterium CG_4_8_14_3_um_filter_31_14]PIY05012.1 MAG: hypothetical protein COZ21_04995 [Bacteroidetes bacterium CG_4_10_14_3_um_filter_31_20]
MTIKIKEKNVFTSLKQFLTSLNIEIVDESPIDDDNNDFYSLSKNHLSKAYSIDEPEYNENMIKEPNPLYERR